MSKRQRPRSADHRTNFINLEAEGGFSGSTGLGFSSEEKYDPSILPKLGFIPFKDPWVKEYVYFLYRKCKEIILKRKKN